MSTFVRGLKGAGYFACTYICVALIVAFFSLMLDLLVKFKQSDTMLVSPENVEIIGNSRLDRNEILFIAGLDRKVSFFDIDKDKTALSLTTCGWVKKAFVEKFMPNSVKITIEEFEPVMIVNSIKRSSDLQKDTFMMWFSDADGILFKRVVAGETLGDLPVFLLNYSVPEDRKKRSEKIKNAISIAKIWNNISSLCKIKKIDYEAVSGYSMECSRKDGLSTIIHLKESFSDADWRIMMQDAADMSENLLTMNKWAGEYEFDEVDNSLTDEKYKMIVGKLVQNVRKGER